MHRARFVLLLAAILGCDSSRSNEMPGSIKGSLNSIEGLLEDMSRTMNAPGYRGASEIRSDIDNIETYLLYYDKSAAGTPFAKDGAEIRQKASALRELANSRAPVDKQRQALKDLQATIEGIKARL